MRVFVSLFVLGLFVACGTPGADGTDGRNCTVKDNGDRTVTLTCTDGTKETFASGANGEDGAAGKGKGKGESKQQVDEKEGRFCKRPQPPPSCAYQSSFIPAGDVNSMPSRFHLSTYLASSALMCRLSVCDVCKTTRARADGSEVRTAWRTLSI